MDRTRRRLAALPRSRKQAIMVAADTVLIPAALWLAFALKYDSLAEGFGRYPGLYVGATIASIVIFAALGLYRTVIRYIGPEAAAAVAAGSLGSAAVVYVLELTVAWRPVPLSVTVIYALIALTWIGGSRFAARWVLLPFRSPGEVVVIHCLSWY